MDRNRKDIIYRVIFDSKVNTRGGKVAHDQHKAVFLDKKYKHTLQNGVGKIYRDSYVETKGNYVFADIRNIQTVIPDNYSTLEFFLGVGVPTEIYKSTYGDCIFLKEVYSRCTYIKAFDKDGNELIKVKKVNSNEDDSSSVSMMYRQVAEVLTQWEDITNSVYTDIIQSLLQKNCVIDLKDTRLLHVIRVMCRDKVVKLKNGVILADGKFETMACWETDERLYAVWLGKKISLDGTDIRNELYTTMEENYLLDDCVPDCNSVSFDTDVSIECNDDLKLVLKEYKLANDRKTPGDRTLLFVEINDVFIEDMSSDDKLKILDYVKQHNKRVLDSVQNSVSYTSKQGVSRKENWRDRVYSKR